MASKTLRSLRPRQPLQQWWSPKPKLKHWLLSFLPFPSPPLLRYKCRSKKSGNWKHSRFCSYYRGPLRQFANDNDCDDKASYDDENQPATRQEIINPAPLFTFFLFSVFHIGLNFFIGFCLHEFSFPQDLSIPSFAQSFTYQLFQIHWLGDSLILFSPLLYHHSERQ